MEVLRPKVLFLAANGTKEMSVMKTKWENLLAFLKKSLNSGISMDQLLTLMGSSLPQTNADQASATKTTKRKKRTKHKIQQVSRAEPSGQNASEVNYWSDKQGTVTNMPTPWISLGGGLGYPQNINPQKLHGFDFLNLRTPLGSSIPCHCHNGAYSP